ncbi:MAG: NADH-quinone oxidoreductase subunit C [Chloroflexota bacterium]
MLDNETAVTLADLLDRVAGCKRDGFRFVTCTGLRSGDGIDVIYHFDRDYKMQHLRLHVQPGSELPSISPVYPGAFLAENELQDFLGLKVTGLPIDYHGHLFLTEDAPVAPMLKVVDKNDPGEGK